MPRTRAASGGRSSHPTRGPAPAVVVSGRSAPLARPDVVRAVAAVLNGERRAASVSVSFLGRERMRELNARWKGRDEPTDVLAFALTDPRGALTGDVYVCPWVSAREARARGLSPREELRRSVVHGVLHVLGYDHPEGAGRTASPMWRRQERYLAGLR